MIFKFIPSYKDSQIYDEYNALIIIAPTKEEAIKHVAENFKETYCEIHRVAFEQAEIKEIIDDGNTTEIICTDYEEA